MKILLHILLMEFLQGTVDSVSLIMTFLAVVAFLVCWGINRISVLRIRKVSKRTKEISTIMKQTLNLTGDYVLRLSLADRLGHNLHGNFLPDEGMGFYESEKYIHPDDWPVYKAFVLKIMGGEATASCNFRWNAGTPEAPVWRNMHDQGIAEYANEQLHTPTNIFCTLTDITDEIRREKEEQQLNDKYREVFEQSIVGLAFYDKDGNLLTTNQKMREILKFQSEDDPYYYSNTIYDMPTFREIINHRKIEELWFCTKSVLVERGVNCYTEQRVHPIYDEEGQLVYITFSIRDITQERELYLQNKHNDEFIRRQSEAIQQYEEELQYLMERCDMRFWRTSLADRTVTFYKRLSIPERVMTFDELAEQFFTEEEQTYFRHLEARGSGSTSKLYKTRPFFHEGREYQWNILDSVPYYDEAGKMAGTYGLIRNVTPLIEKQEQLKRETERANESGHMKSVFMANMTHEIRTPLNSIVGFSDVLPMMQSPEEKQEIVKVIMSNCDMLLRLINDILAVSTLDSDGVKIVPQEVDFAKTFDQICVSMAERVQQTPGVEFIKDNPYETLVTTLDPGRIQQVITNFVTNAVKYTRQGHIKVGYRRQDGGLYIYCEDTGAGIPKEAQQKVFERFVKLNDYVQGTGLGLAISKAIIERCDGRIGVISEGSGKGSTFWMWIPCEMESDKEYNNE